MHPRNGILIAATLLTATLLAATATAQVEFDVLAGPYPYEQPDASGDSTAAAAATWGDITALRATTLADGSVLFQMQFVDLARTTGELRYCVFFEVDGTAYQAGYRGQVINGSPNGAPTSCTWSDSGTTVGTPAIDAANDIITVTITAEELENPAPGTMISSIEARIGAVVTGVGQGSTNLFDTLTPSVDPVDFEYGLGAAPSAAAVLGLTTETANVTAAPGGDATFSVTVVNKGADNATVNATAEGLPEGFGVSVDPANTTLAANETVTLNVTIAVPEDANETAYPFLLRVEGANGGNATLNVTLVVEAPSAPTGDEPTPAGNDTAEGNGTVQSDDGAGIPGPGAVAAAGALLAALAGARRLRRRE